MIKIIIKHTITSLVFGLLLVNTLATAQEIQWASQLIFQYNGFKESGAWSGEKLLGAPDAYPYGSLNENAFRLSTEEAYATVTLGFDNPQVVKEILIAENFKPGRVSKVVVFDAQGKEYTVFEHQPQDLGIYSRILTIPTESIDFPVNKLTVHVNAISAKGWCQIDAVGISSLKVNEETIREISQSEKTVIAEEITFSAQKERLSSLINTEYKEIKPLISPDGATLYFVRQNYPSNIGGKKDMQDIYFSDHVNGKWRLAQNIGAPLNDREPNGICSVSPDGNTVLVINAYNPDGSIEGNGVSISHRTRDGWTHPERIHIEGFQNRNRFQDFYLSNSERYLLLAIEMPDSHGDQDLYVSFRQEDGSFSTPVNLGPVVNTPKVEYSPFLAADNRTLYFSSDGHGGFGGSDIFYTRRLDDTWKKWTTPVNIGKEINTTAWDAYYTVTARGDYAYFVSTMDEKSKKEVNEDIYRISLKKDIKPDPVIMLAGRVLDKKTNQPVDAEINYESLSDKSEEGIAKTSPLDGSYKIVIPAGKKYGFLAKAKGYISVLENEDFTEVDDFLEKEKNLYLVPIEVGQIVQLNNLFFVQSKAEILPESETELERLYQLMTDNDNMEIMLRGHTDNQGFFKSNMELSQLRADAIMNYLIERGVSRRRISAKGYGPTLPIDNNNTPEGRIRNRRVEVEILKID